MTNPDVKLTWVTVDLFESSSPWKVRSRPTTLRQRGQFVDFIFKKFLSESTFSVSGDSEQPLGQDAARNAVSKQDGEVISGTVEFFRTCDSDELM